MGIPVLWALASLSLPPLSLLSKSEILRVPQGPGVMELQGDILQGRLMFSCSLSPMDRSSITHLMCPLNLHHQHQVCKAQGCWAPSVVA